MKPSSPIVCALFFFACAAPLTAQVHLFGCLEQGPTPNEFEIGCTNVRLQSTTVQLSSLVGEVVEVLGTNVGTTASPLIDVTSAAVTDHTFSLGGNGKIGGELRFCVESPSATSYYLFYSLQQGFLPFDPLFPKVHGTLYLDYGTTVALFSGPISGSWEERIPVPNTPQLVGLQVWTQAAVLVPGPELLYLNADCVTISQ